MNEIRTGQPYLDIFSVKAVLKFTLSLSLLADVFVSDRIFIFYINMFGHLHCFFSYADLFICHQKV